MSNKPYNLPLIRKYASETIDLAAVIDQVLSGIGSGVTISSVDATATVRDPEDASEVSSGGPTISSIDKNSSTYTRSNGETYSAGKVIQYTAAGGTAGEVYWLDFEVTPSSGSGPVVVRQPLAVD